MDKLFRDTFWPAIVDPIRKLISPTTAAVMGRNKRECFVELRMGDRELENAIYERRSGNLAINFFPGGRGEGLVEMEIIPI